MALIVPTTTAPDAPRIETAQLLGLIDFAGQLARGGVWHGFPELVDRARIVTAPFIQGETKAKHAIKADVESRDYTPQRLEKLQSQHVEAGRVVAVPGRDMRAADERKLAEFKIRAPRMRATSFDASGQPTIYGEPKPQPPFDAATMIAITAQQQWLTQNMKPADIAAAYLNAKEAEFAGEPFDADLVRVVEAAPRFYNWIPDRVRERVEEAAIASNGLGATLAAYEYLVSIERQIETTFDKVMDAISPRPVQRVVLRTSATGKAMPVRVTTVGDDGTPQPAMR